MLAEIAFAVCLHFAIQWIVNCFILPRFEKSDDQLQAAVSIEQPLVDDASHLAPPAAKLRHETPMLTPRHFPPSMPVEQCNWVNTLIQSLFQRHQQKDVTSRWCDNLNREFAQLEEKSKVLSYIYASHLDLGHSPPEIKFIQILPTDASRKDLRMQAKFIYYGGFSMELHTQIQLYSVLEAHVKVTVLDCTGDMLLHVDAGAGSTDSTDAMDVTLSLASDPVFNLEIKSVVGSYSDLSMLKQIIAGTFKLVFRKMFVTPNGKRYRWAGPRVNPITGLIVKGWQPHPIDVAEKKLQIERSKKKKPNIGTRVPAVGRLFVTLVKANDLKAASDASNYTGNPYCITTFNRQNRKSKVITRSTDPVWDEKFQFDVFDNSDNIVFSVYDRDRFGKDNFLGHFMAPLSAQPVNRALSDQVHPLSFKTQKEGTSGSITVNIMYEPFSDNVIGGVHTVVYNKELGLSQFENAFIEVSMKMPVPQIKRESISNHDLSLQEVDAVSVGSPRGHSKSFDGEPSSASLKTSRPISTFSVGSESAGLSDAASVTDERRGATLSRGAVSPWSSTHDLNTMPSGYSPPQSPRSRHSEPSRYNLIVTVQQARGLVSSDTSGFSDPYCVVIVNRQQKKTKIVKKSLSPIWQEELSFAVPAIPTEIVIDVLSYNRFSQPPFLGQARIAVSDEWNNMTSADFNEEKVSVTRDSLLGFAKSYDLQQRPTDARSPTPVALTTVTGALEVSYDIIPMAFAPIGNNAHMDAKSEASVDSHTTESTEMAPAFPTGSSTLRSLDTMLAGPIGVSSPVFTSDHSAATSEATLSQSQRAAAIQHRAAAAKEATKEMAKSLASNLTNRWKASRRP